MLPVDSQLQRAGASKKAGTMPVRSTANSEVVKSNCIGRFKYTLCRFRPKLHFSFYLSDLWRLESSGERQRGSVPVAGWRFLGEVEALFVAVEFEVLEEFRRAAARVAKACSPGNTSISNVLKNASAVGIS
jgi:hypothetical protein